MKICLKCQLALTCKGNKLLNLMFVCNTHCVRMQIHVMEVASSMASSETLQNNSYVDNLNI